MKELKYLGLFSIIFFIVIIGYAFHSLLEIIFLWTDFSFNTSFFQSNLHNNTKLTDTKHLLVTTIYLSLNIVLILPSFWYIKILKIINKKDYYNPVLYNLFDKVSTILTIAAIIPIFLLRIIPTDQSYVTPYFWFNIHPTFIILLAGLLKTFSLILKDAIKYKQENELTI